MRKTTRGSKVGNSKRKTIVFIKDIRPKMQPKQYYSVLNEITCKNRIQN